MSGPSNIVDLKNYYKDSHAIIIGISKYQEESPLNNAFNDAKAVQEILTNEYGFNDIISLFNEQATLANIREIFFDVLQDDARIGPKDRVLIYYSGHGKLRTRINYNGQEVKEGYILPY